MADLTGPALKLAGTTADAVSRVLEALLRIMEQREITESDKIAIRNFERYVKNGGQLMTAPVQKSSSGLFEKYMAEAGVQTIRTKLRTEDDMYEYILRADDMGKLDNIARQMELEGKPLTQSYQKTMTDLTESANGKILSTKLRTDVEANHAIMELNIHKIPFSAVQQANGLVFIYVPEQQIERLKAMDVFDGLEFEDKSRTVSVREADAKLEAAKARAEQEKARNENEKGKGRTYQ